MFYFKWVAYSLLLLSALESTAKESTPWTNDKIQSYYESTLSLKGDALKTTLHRLVKNHRQYNYRQLWRLLAKTDKDFSKPDHVILFYSEWSRHKEDHGGQPSEWNREHVWAKSRGRFGTRTGAGTDLHHIRPTDVSINSKRSNKDFDEGGKIVIDKDGKTKNRVSKMTWEPRDEVKGDVARMLFYMAVRYEKATGLDLELTEKIQRSNQPVHGRLSTLLKWHQSDPVDDRERYRNQIIYELQGNRNPFIDKPEFAALIWPLKK